MIINGKILKPVLAIKVEWSCCKCNEGTMVFTGNILIINPPLYEHKCTHCDYMMGYRESYPYYEEEKSSYIA